MRRSSLLTGAVLVAATLVTPACTGDQPAPTSAPAAGAPTGGAPTVAPGGPTASADLGEPVATRESSYEQAKVRLTVYPVQRSGQLATLTMRLTLLAPEPGRDSWTPYNVLSDQPFKPFRVSGVRLLDGKNKKLYLVATDTRENCICSGPLNTGLRRGDAILVSAAYAAPPPDVTTVDVVTTTFGTITGVPVR
jgi:hypothetical protein